MFFISSAAYVLVGILLVADDTMHSDIHIIFSSASVLILIDHWCASDFGIVIMM